MKLPVASCVVTLVLLKFILDLNIIVHSTLIVSLHTVVSRASAHGYSQLMHQKLRVGSCTHAPKIEGGQLHSCTKNWGWAVAQRRCFYRGQPNSGKGCNMLWSIPTHSLFAVACIIQILCYRGITLQMRPRTSVCKPEQSQLCELSGPTFGFTI